MINIAKEDGRYMRLAIEQAEIAEENGDVSKLKKLVLLIRRGI